MIPAARQGIKNRMTTFDRSAVERGNFDEGDSEPFDGPSRFIIASGGQWRQDALAKLKQNSRID